MAQREATAEAAAEWVDIGALNPWEDNPRHNDAAVPEVAASIRRFGFAAPIVARRADGMVIAGHTRLRAAQSLGLDRVPVRFMDLDPADAKLLAIADNKVGEIAEWDAKGLAEVMADLDIGEATEGLGFSESEMKELLQPMPDLDMDELSDSLDHLSGESAYAIVRISVDKDQVTRIEQAAVSMNMEGGKAERIGAMMLHFLDEAGL